MGIDRGADNVVGRPGEMPAAVREAIAMSAGQPSIDTLTPAQARALPELLAPAPEPVAMVLQRSIAGPGGLLAIRTFRPAGVEPPAAFVYLHGGGWVLGTLDGADATCRRLANATGCAVVSVDYRLAPEHKFPAALEDAYAAMRWVAAQGAGLGIDATRMVVGGTSAGANLAAAACLLARERGGPALAMQVLLVPPLWMAFDATESMRVNARGYGLDRSTMEWFARQYVRGDADASDPLVSPHLAPDHSALPPAVIVTAELDPLRDDGELYARRLRAAGVEATLIRYAGMIHGFMDLAAEAADLAFRHVGGLVRARLAELAR